MKCEAYEPGCPNWGEYGPKTPKKFRVHTTIVTLKLKTSYMRMCPQCKFNRLQKYPELKEYQRRGHVIIRSEEEKI